MSYHAISDLRLSAAQVSRASAVEAAFTLKNLIVYDGKRRTSYIQFFRLCVDIGGRYPIYIGREIAVGDDIPYGRSKAFTLGFRINAAESPSLAAYLAANPSVRALPVKLEISSCYENDFGGAAAADYFDLPLIYLRDFCMPQIEAFSLERSIAGLPDDEGEDMLTTLKLSVNSGADISALGLRLHYAENAEATTQSDYIDLTAKIPALLSGATDSADLIPRSFSNGGNWDFLLFFGDQYESASAKRSLARAFANFHLSGAKTGGACFGGFSSSKAGDPKLESYYPGYFYGGIHGVSIFSFQEVKTGGRWADDKPLYTKVLKLTGAKSKVNHDIAVPADVETAWVDPSGSFCLSSNGSVYPVSYMGTDGTAVFQAQYRPDLKAVRVATYTGTSADFYIKIFYTKSTDEIVERVKSHTAFFDSDENPFMDANDLSFMTEVY